QIILYHGQIVQARNIDVMLKAMSLVKKDFPNVKLLIVGEVADSYKIQLEQIVKQNHLEDVIEFRKPIPYINVPELIKEATIGLSSMAPNESFKRSIQIKPFEFMAMGIPVLGCRVPSTEIFIEQTGSGILVDPPTAENLGKTINYLLQNPRVMEQMGKHGRKAVSEKYNWSFMENKLYDIYEEVLMC
ncbi:MAG: glycosyltransferase, partial [Candidatus Marinimicrobia bacterium]|nr:glycosyltransferase [Candidatus Neomarinimicrobiota bacterium]